MKKSTLQSGVVTVLTFGIALSYYSSLHSSPRIAVGMVMGEAEAKEEDLD